MRSLWRVSDWIQYMRSLWLGLHFIWFYATRMCRRCRFLLLAQQEGNTKWDGVQCYSHIQNIEWLDKSVFFYIHLRHFWKLHEKSAKCLGTLRVTHGQNFTTASLGMATASLIFTRAFGLRSSEKSDLEGCFALLPRSNKVEIKSKIISSHDERKW